MSGLRACDHLFLRLWGCIHHGFSIPSKPETPEIDYDPWPTSSERANKHLPIPQEIAAEDWILTDGGSSGISTYLTRTQVLRLAKNEEGTKRIELESRVLSNGTYPLPSVVRRGDTWLIIEKMKGSRPQTAGPWIDDLAELVQSSLHIRPSLLPYMADAPLDDLSSVVGKAAVDLLLTTCKKGERIVPTHGDLHCGNLLINKAGNLCGVLDFEYACNAPVEREAAVWISVLAGQIGIKPVADLAAKAFPGGLSGAALRHEITRHLDLAAAYALSRASFEAHRKTVKTLVAMLLDDPSLPLNILGVKDVDGG